MKITPNEAQTSGISKIEPKPFTAGTNIGQTVALSAETMQLHTTAPQDSIALSDPAHRIVSSSSATAAQDALTETPNGVSAQETLSYLEALCDLDDAIEVWTKEAREKGLRGGAVGAYIFGKMDEYLAEKPYINQYREKAGRGDISGKVIVTNYKTSVHTLSQPQAAPTASTSAVRSASAQKAAQPEKPADTTERASKEFAEALGQFRQSFSLWAANALSISGSRDQTAGYMLGQWNTFLNQTPAVQKYLG